MASWITLSEAAAMLGLSYNRTLRLVLIGDLRGEQRHGRWVVDEAAAEQLGRSRLRREPPPNERATSTPLGESGR